MKYVLLINGMLIGGAERFVYTLLEKLKKEVDIELVSLQKKQEIKLDIPNLKITYLSNMTGDEPGILKMIMIPIWALRLIKHIKKNNINLVQSHLYRANYVNLIAKQFYKNFKSEIFLHGVPQQYSRKGLLGKTNTALIKILFPKADRILTNSCGMKKAIIDFLPFKKEISVYYNSFNIKNILQKSDEEISEKFIQNGVKYIISVGRLYKSKRQLDILKAFELIEKKITNIELIFLGDGDEKENLLNYVNKNILQDKVHFLGNITNPYKYISRSFVSILASESESFGNVIIESMTCGIPVISADCDFGPREILCLDKERKKITNGYELVDFGVLYAVGDSTALSDAIMKLILDERLYEKYKKNIKVRSEKFDIDNHKSFPDYYLERI